jgi:signal transduction histidine kinase/DNA-binding NarL/FixJ family response regulator
MNLPRPLMKLRFKVLLFMIPLLLLLSFAHTWDSIRAGQEVIRNEIIKRAEAITTLATKTGELPILSGNPEQLKGTALFLKSNSEVAAVSFYDTRMTLLMHDGLQPAAHPAEPPGPASLSMSEEPHAFVFYAPVFTEKDSGDFDIISGMNSSPKTRETIGWIRIAFSKSVLHENERRIAGRGIAISLAFALVSCLAAYFLMGIVTRPLSQIVRMADGVSHGDFSHNFEIDQHDEVGALANSFSTMRQTIQQVLQETEELINAVRDGRLESRSNAARFEGEWRDLVEGVNQLAAAFAQGVVDLQKAKENAESANRSKSVFLSNMSHELRTPLNALLGYTQILNRNDNLTETQHAQLELMRSSGEHLLSLINDVLDVGRIEADKISIEHSVYNLPALVRQVYSLTCLSAEQKWLDLVYQERSPLPIFVRGDERRLRQILLNLLGNAVKYTDHGSVTLSIDYDVNNDGTLLCEVIDTGVGIPAEQAESIFEPFTQLEGPNRQRQGTGLGLSISRCLLELMNGHLSLESSVGAGSTFRFMLPLPTVQASSIAMNNDGISIEGYPGEPKRILVVDDNSDNAAMLVTLLSKLGFDVDSSDSGSRALDKALEWAPHLIIMDLVMPQIDGLETIRLMRSFPQLEKTVFIGTSAPASGSEHKNEFIGFCDDFIAKPIRINDLLEKVGKLLNISWDGNEKVPPGHMAKSVDGGEKMTAPPPDQLDVLLDLALRGDMLAVEEWAARLSDQHPEYKLFSQKLIQLARGFKTNKLLELVQQYRGDKHD